MRYEYAMLDKPIPETIIHIIGVELWCFSPKKIECMNFYGVPSAETTFFSTAEHVRV